MLSLLPRPTLSRWLHRPAGRILACLALGVLIGVQAQLTHHASRHRSCSAPPAAGPTGCEICAAAANFTATEPPVLQPGEAAFSGFLVLPSLPSLPDAAPVLPAARGPPPAVV